MKQKGQIVEILPTSPIYSSDLSSSLSTETDFLSASQKRQYSLFDGILVGEHDGWSNFRLGQRKGINVGGKKKPLYVIGINKKENRVFVGEGIDHPGLLTKVIAIEKNENIDYKKILTIENNTPVELKIELENHSVPAFFYEFEHYIFIRLNKLFRIDLFNHKISIHYKNTVLLNIFIP